MVERAQDLTRMAAGHLAKPVRNRASHAPTSISRVYGIAPELGRRGGLGHDSLERITPKRRTTSNVTKLPQLNAYHESRGSSRAQPGAVDEDNQALERARSPNCAPHVAAGILNRDLFIVLLKILLSIKKRFIYYTFRCPFFILLYGDLKF